VSFQIVPAVKCKVDILSGTTKLESWLCICIPRWQVANPDDHSGAFIKGLGFLKIKKLDL